MKQKIKLKKKKKHWFDILIEELIEIRKKIKTKLNIIANIGRWKLGERIEKELKLQKGKWERGKAIEQIADKLGTSRSNIYYWLQFYEKFPPNSDGKVSNSLETLLPLNWNEIIRNYLPRLPKEIKEKEYSWFRFYDVWNFAARDYELGIGHPGNIPGQIVRNILYYFTEEGDLIVDPFGGGGSTLDACKLHNRRCKIYDIKPKRLSIKKHDIAKGFPIECKNCDLIFLDPPYFKKKEKEYGSESISNLNRGEYLIFFKKLARDCFQTLKKNGIVAFLMSNYIDYETYENSIFIDDYVPFFQKVGFKIYMKIQCPLSTEQYKPYQEKQAKDNKKILIRSRDLIIFKKDE